MDSFILIAKKPEDENEGPTWIPIMDKFCRGVLYTEFRRGYIYDCDYDFICEDSANNWSFDKRWCKVLKVAKRL